MKPIYLVLLSTYTDSLVVGAFSTFKQANEAIAQLSATPGASRDKPSMEMITLDAPVTHCCHISVDMGKGGNVLEKSARLSNAGLPCTPYFAFGRELYLTCTFRTDSYEEAINKMDVLRKSLLAAGVLWGNYDSLQQWLHP